ncbi:MAG: hypothetical protein EP297_09465 [Gammaproteobacteria bacterium]|nr:MAG: hypothetical protein EP297_09465 [Gammaproteobacteria bacterium]
MMGSRIKLRVINGGKPQRIQISAVELICINSISYPVPSITHILEEDTWQVLSADPGIREVDEHPIRIMTGLIDQKPLAIGDIITRGKNWQAVVYDFDQEPICRKEWVEAAMRKLLEKTEEKQLHEISLPLLGSIHGCLSWIESLEVIIQGLRSQPTQCLKRVWLDVAEDRQDDIQQKLLEEADNSGIF